METSTALEKTQQGDSDNNQSSVPIETKLQLKSNVSIHKFSTKVMDSQIFYQISKFGTILFIWIGGSDCCLKDLVFASGTPYDKGKSPISTRLLGNVGETLSMSLAVKLTQKLKKPVYVSYNLVQNNDSGGVQDIISRIMEEITLCPEKF